MKACLSRSTAPIESAPLEYTAVPTPVPGPDEVLVRVRRCAVCRTDLHVVEGDLPPRKLPIIPGHQVVGIVEKAGDRASRFKPGDRVGIAWLHSTCGVCEYCRSGRENLCDNPTFTGWVVDGGYAEQIVAKEQFVYAIPEVFTDEEAAPLLCAGIIGFRSLRVSAIEPGGRLGLYGFGAAAHLAIQVALHWKCEVYAATRDARHQKLALELEAGSEGLPHESLSDREYRVMWMIASGKTISNIAEELILSPNTVSTYRIRILKKLKLDSNTDLVRYAMKHGLVE